MYTTNAIESINFQLRKITKNRGHFPDKDAAMKLLYLGLRNISSQRGGDSGTGTHGWKVALNTLINLFPGRISVLITYRCKQITSGLHKNHDRLGRQRQQRTDLVDDPVGR